MTIRMSITEEVKSHDEFLVFRFGALLDVVNSCREQMGSRWKVFSSIIRTIRCLRIGNQKGRSGRTAFRHRILQRVLSWRDLNAILQLPSPTMVQSS